MTAFWKDGCDEGGLAWDDTNNNRAFLAGEICATLNGASIYIAAKRSQEKIKDDKGEPLVRDIQHARLPAGPAGSWSYHTAFAHGVMKYGKNQKLAKDFLKWLHGKEQFGKWFQVAEGFSIGSTKFWEQHPLWATIDEPMKGFRTAARQLARHRLRGAAERQGHRGLLQVRHRGHVRQGRAGHEAGRRGQVGGGRAARRSTG